MYDLVGDRLQAIFDAQVVDIGIVDRAAEALRHHRTRSNAGFASPGTSPDIVGFRRHVLDTRAAAPVQRACGGAIARVRRGGRCSGGRAVEVSAVRSAHRRRRGVRRDLAAEPRSRARVHARQTSACSRRSPAASAWRSRTRGSFEEARQRNAELALINDVQRGLAKNLEMQAMYDLVGDRIRDIFDARWSTSASSTRTPG